MDTNKTDYYYSGTPELIDHLFIDHLVIERWIYILVFITQSTTGSIRVIPLMKDHLTIDHLVI